MLAQEQSVLRNFPLVIDPVAASLEVQMSPRGDNRAKPTWAQLQRVQPKHDTFPFSMNSRMVHFFGSEPTIEDCPFLLAYDVSGVLRYRINREEGEFTAYELPEELNGRPVLRPSLRVTFREPEEAQHCFGLLDTLKTRGLLPPDGVDLLHRLLKSSEVRFTTVARQ